MIHSSRSPFLMRTGVARVACPPRPPQRRNTGTRTLGRQGTSPSLRTRPSPLPVWPVRSPILCGPAAGATPHIGRRRATTSGRSAALERLGELSPQPGPQLGTHVDDWRKGAAELAVVGDAGVDQDAVVEVAGERHGVAP